MDKRLLTRRVLAITLLCYPSLNIASVCNSDLECSGANGACAAGSCRCKPGWRQLTLIQSLAASVSPSLDRGVMCNELDFVPQSARVAYESPLWTWGGSPIGRDPVKRFYGST